MKRALLVLPRMKMQPFGEQTYLAHLFRAMVASSTAYDFSTFAVGLKGRAEHFERLSIIDSAKQAKHYWDPLPQTMFEALIKNRLPTPDERLFAKSDIVHSFNSQLVPESTKNFVLTIHDLSNLRFLAGEDTEERNNRIREALRKLTSRAKKIITISHFSKKEIVELLNIEPARIDVIHNGVDTNHFRPITKAEEPEANNFLKSLGIVKPYMLHVGGASPRKNLKNLLLSYSIIRDRCKTPLNFVIGGLKNPPPEIQHVLDECKYRSDICTPGYLSDQELLWLMQSADMLVFPSLYEGFGMPPLEAMACGVPTVLSKLSSLPEVGGDAAVYSETEQAESIADAVIHLSSNDSLRQKNIDLGLKRAAFMSWAANADSTLRLYSELI